MREPAQEEIDVVTGVSMCSQAEAVAVVQALDAHRGECVPINRLRAKMAELYGHKSTIRSRDFMAWLDRRGWLDEAGK